jgi:hypothetical protein
MQEIEAGLWHWSSVHPNHGQRVSSYAFEPARALIDAMVPDDEDSLDELGFEPERIILSCRHHRRGSDELRERYGAELWVREEGAGEFDDVSGLRTFAGGDAIADGVLAIDVDALSADETALHLDVGPGALCVADGLMRNGFDGDIGFVPDNLLGEDPEGVKRDIRAQFALILETCPPFEHLLFAHGAPITGEGRAALERFLSS